MRKIDAQILEGWTKNQPEAAEMYATFAVVDNFKLNLALMTSSCR